MSDKHQISKHFRNPGVFGLRWRAPSFNFYGSFFKRIFDVSIILMALPFVLPLIAIAAFMVARDGGDPFYKQDRVGKNGRIFTIWKLRTMVVDAKSELDAYLAANPDAAEEWKVTQKLRHDPRITSVGRFLRKSSLDELPQLLNVFLGHMSLVGPRPMMPEQQELYPGFAYYKERPGITGRWQVSARNSTTFADRARFDTDYVAELSFVNDVKILVATVGVVTRGTGC